MVDNLELNLFIEGLWLVPGVTDVCRALNLLVVTTLSSDDLGNEFDKSNVPDSSSLTFDNLL